MSNPDLNVVCRRLETPFPGGTYREFAGWYKILQLIERIPFIP